MSPRRTLLVAIVMSALFVLLQAHAIAGEPERNAPHAFAPSTVMQPTALELLAAAAQVPRDYTTALYWFQKAIVAGSAEAMSNLATMYLRGTGLPRDQANALRWFARAAAGGNVHGMHTVAVTADEGIGAPRDPRLLGAMYRRAAESGFPPAMLKISDRCVRS